MPRMGFPVIGPAAKGLGVTIAKAAVDLEQFEELERGCPIHRACQPPSPAFGLPRLGM